MGGHHELVAGLVEADVAVAAHTQQLQVGAAQAADKGVIPGALGLGILGQTVGHVGALGAHVDVVEQVVLHEVAVALVVSAGQALVLVQVHGGHAGKGNLPRLVTLHQALVGADGRGAGSQAQHALGLHNHLSGDDAGRLLTHLIIVLRCINPNHGMFLLFHYSPLPLRAVL